MGKDSESDEMMKGKEGGKDGEGDERLNGKDGGMVRLERLNVRRQ